MSFEYAEESDPDPYPTWPDAPVEGGRGSDGDRHVLVVDRDERKALGELQLPSGRRWQLMEGRLRGHAEHALQRP